MCWRLAFLISVLMTAGQAAAAPGIERSEFVETLGCCRLSIDYCLSIAASCAGGAARVAPCRSSSSLAGWMELSRGRGTCAPTLWQRGRWHLARQSTDRQEPRTEPWRDSLPP